MGQEKAGDDESDEHGRSSGGEPKPGWSRAQGAPGQWRTDTFAGSEGPGPAGARLAAGASGDRAEGAPGAGVPRRAPYANGSRTSMRGKRR